MATDASVLAIAPPHLESNSASKQAPALAITAASAASAATGRNSKKSALEIQRDFRRRRAEKLTSLESNVALMEMENARLKRENERLVRENGELKSALQLQVDARVRARASSHIGGREQESGDAYEEVREGEEEEEEEEEVSVLNARTKKRRLSPVSMATPLSVPSPSSSSYSSSAAGPVSSNPAVTVNSRPSMPTVNWDPSSTCQPLPSRDLSSIATLRANPDPPTAKEWCAKTFPAVEGTTIEAVATSKMDLASVSSVSSTTRADTLKAALPGQSAFQESLPPSRRLQGDSQGSHYFPSLDCTGTENALTGSAVSRCTFSHQYRYMHSFGRPDAQGAAYRNS